MAARLNHQLTGPDDAPVVVLGGCLGSAIGLMRAQVDALSDRLRVLTFEHRGHGTSEVPPRPYTLDDLGGDVLALLDELGIERASYAGVSLGGMVGLWLAENAPGRWHRFVLMCAAAAPPGTGPQMWTERAALVRAEGMAPTVDATIARWFNADHPDKGRIRQELLDTPAEGYAACCEAIGAMDLRDGLAGITAPVLLIAGDGDQSVPAEKVLETAKAIPGARFEVLENAAHLVAVTHADQVNALLREHLALPW